LSFLLGKSKVSPRVMMETNLFVVLWSI